MCDYKAASKLMTNSAGREFVSRQMIYTELADVVEGDQVLIGTYTEDPVTAGAWEVKAVTRFADTFERKADDFLILT